MACNFVNNYNHSIFCDGAGGVKKWYVFPTFIEGTTDNSVVFTYDPDGTIASVTPDSAFDAETMMGEWLVDMETSTFTDTGVGERVNKARAREQEATVVFHGTSDVLVAELDQMIGRYTVIAQDNRGLNHVLFIENGGMITDVFTPGTALTDQYAHTLTITGREVKKAPIISDEDLLLIIDA